MTPTEGDIIRAERARERQYEADQIHITAHYCQMCGVKLDERGHCPHGCLDNSIASVIIAAYSKPATQYKPVARCPECFCEIGACENTAPIESMSAEHIRNGQA